VEELPDLSDVIKHPGKYAEPEPEIEEPDEEKLLESINNVKFKPFYDGSQEFEILNNFDNEKNDNPFYDLDSVNFEVVEKVNEIEIKTVIKDNIENKEESEFQEEKMHEPVIQKNIIEPETKDNSSSKTKEVLDKINAVKSERSAKMSENTETKTDIIKEHELVQIEDARFSLINSVKFDNNWQFSLAKNEDKYFVLVKQNGNYKIIKECDTLSNEKFQVRLSEKLEDGSLRYIIRVAPGKFVIEVDESEAHFVMDL